MHEFHIVTRAMDGGEDHEVIAVADRMVERPWGIAVYRGASLVGTFTFESLAAAYRLP